VWMDEDIILYAKRGVWFISWEVNCLDAVELYVSPEAFPTCLYLLIASSFTACTMYGVAILFICVESDSS
jgi:hypothetical protein